VSYARKSGLMQGFSRRGFFWLAGGWLRFVNQSRPKLAGHCRRFAMKNSRLKSALGALLCLLLAPLPAHAAPELCENAARRAASERGVPVDVLLAIALTETGRMRDGVMRPWPWAANLDGQGHWFDTPAHALAFAESALAVGRTGFDLGCFQINWHWHGDHFASPRAMLDPLEGARYAAGFLADLAAELGSWERAAGAYHSRTPHLAARYRSRFDEMRAGLADRSVAEGSTPLPDATPPAPRRINTFPLLLATASSDTPHPSPLASLMPATTAHAPAFLPALHEQIP